jgi:hypothetical protein
MLAALPPAAAPREAAHGDHRAVHRGLEVMIVAVEPAFSAAC